MNDLADSVIEDSALHDLIAPQKRMIKSET